MLLFFDIDGTLFDDRRRMPASVRPALEKAKQNHKRLCVTMVEAMIYSRPDIVRALELHGTLPRYEQEDAAAAGAGPSAEHWLGTDYLGRDVLWRAAAGTATAFKVGIAGAGIAVLIGVTLGLAAGHFGGWVDGLVVCKSVIFAAF